MKSEYTIEDEHRSLLSSVSKEYNLLHVLLVMFNPRLHPRSLDRRIAQTSQTDHSRLNHRTHPRTPTHTVHVS